MGRRRFRFLPIAAFMLCLTKDVFCQDTNDFYYTPVERSFAQVQPPLFPSNRPSTYFEHGDNFRVAQPSLASPSQQPLYNEGHVRFPSPNYNQNPSPFQLPTGRSQAGTQYFINQPEFTSSQRQRFRPSPPHNYQLVHPASTKRPDLSQIHSVAYQNDPSKPEAFLGQVTLNNPDFDYLQNGRFKNIQFDSNSLKNPSHNNNHGLSNDDDLDNDNQDLFEHHRVTTYNPNKLANRQRVIKPSSGRFSHFDSSSVDEKNNYRSPSRVVINSSKVKTASREDSSFYRDTSTEYKSLVDIEPLLEDDVSDVSTFRELMKNNKPSYDVQIIKNNTSHDADSNPSASSMDSDNLSKAHPPSVATQESSSESPRKHRITTTTEITSVENHDDVEDASHENSNQSGEVEEDAEYVEYYDDIDTTTTTQRTTSTSTTTRATTTEHVEPTEEYEDYDTTEEIVQSTEKLHPNNNSDSFDVVVLKDNKTMVNDDNFKHFVDTTVIDQTEHISSNESSEYNTEVPITSEVTNSEEVATSSAEVLPSADTPSILGQEVVSVVTTKSVVNGTISIPENAYTSTTPKGELPSVINSQNDNTSSVTTENWVVVASVQTSRSVSGARFLPFPTVEQEEKKQVLTDDEISKEDDFVDNVTKNPGEMKEVTSQESVSASTENINDKLDSIQSELSSGVLSGSLEGDDKNIEIITETTTKIPTTTTPISLNVFTLKSTQQPSVTEKSAPEPLPVQIKKFTPRPSSTSTTPKPKKKLVTVMDDLAPGLLPPGYKFRPSYKDKRTSTTTTSTTTTTTTTITTSAPETSSEEEIINGTQGRSIGNNGKNKVILVDNKAPFVPKTFKPKDTKSPEDLFKKFQQDDLSKFLPPGFKPESSQTSDSTESKADILDKVQKVDSTTQKSKLPIAAKPVDISAFLPPGFKLDKAEAPEIPLKNIKIADVSNLLPPGFQLNTTAEPTTTTTTTKAPSNGFKLVFPSRPGNKPTRKTTTPKIESGPVPVTPKIQRGWPVRASTEFTGWPSPSTTPFSIEKLLEAQRNATATSPMPDLSTEAATRRTTTTTTTTVAPPPPTTPGICVKECDIAATIKIVSGAKWVPELLDRNTEEWKILAKEVKEELNSVYSQSDSLNKWYKGIRIDGFSKGPVLVDYSIELNDVEEKIDTIELKKLFHKSLNTARPGSVVEKSEEDTGFDPDVMLGDQPDEDRLNSESKIVDKSAGKLEIGKFVMDPAYTEFIVLPKREVPMYVDQEEESILPQWGIAVIVIAMASLLFVVIFGVTVLVNRQKSAKAKQPIPLSDDMFRELDKNHMGGLDDFHQMKERDIPYHSGKRMSTAFIEQLAYQNPGDSWRSEWTPQLQKHMQHYTPDSGRGSQIYGTSANLYGYGGGGGSQIYGHTGGGGSQIYGYMGDYPRSHHSRRRSDYDNNF